MRLISLLVVGLVLISCKKDPVNGGGEVELNHGMLVLCEGLFQQNNSTLSWVNFTNGSEINTFFLNQNARQLGDTGNDMEVYDGKIFIVVNVSSTIEVLSANTGKVIKQIEMIENGVAKQPRSIAFSGDKAYVSCFDGYVDVIDINSLEVEERIQVGLNPEGLAVSGQRLFVANSGGLSLPQGDSTVSVIDLTSNTELFKVNVGLNPGGVEVDDQGEVYVITRGDYNSIPSRMHRINPNSGIVEESFTFDASGITKMNGKFLISYSDFSSGQNQIGLFNTATEMMEDATFIDVSSIETVYGVAYNEFKDRIYVTDAKNFSVTGYVNEFDNAGAYIKNYHVGLNPSKMLFYE